MPTLVRLARLLMLTSCVGCGLGACNLPASLRPQPAGVTEVMKRPGERNLLAGLRAYDDGDYGESEKFLGDALSQKLISAKDRATAHKTLAFMYCTTGRTVECEKAFRSARLADPKFELSKAEAGHPLWGPVYLESRR